MWSFGWLSLCRANPEADVRVPEQNARQRPATALPRKGARRRELREQHRRENYEERRIEGSATAASRAGGTQFISIITQRSLFMYSSMQTELTLK